MKQTWLPASTLLLFSGTVRAAEPSGSTAFELFKVLMALLVVLGMMAGTVWLMKRSGLSKAASGSTIKVVGGVSVGNRERVLVLEVGDQWIVVGVAPGRVNSLATLPRQEQPPLPPSGQTTLDANNFASWLKQKIEKRNAS